MTVLKLVREYRISHKETKTNLGRSYQPRLSPQQSFAMFGPFRWPWWKRVRAYWSDK